MSVGMISVPRVRPLDELARRHGVQVVHTDQRGRRRRAPVDTVVAVLRALGVALAGPNEAPEVLRAEDGEGGRVIEPVLVRRDGTMSTHAIVLPATLDPDAVDISLWREDGTAVSQPLTALLVEPEVSRPISSTCGAPLRRRFHLPAVPDGYHRLTVEGRGVEAEAVVVAAPARCPQPPRGWGVLAPLHALRTATDWGVATYRDLGEVGSWVAELGGSFVGTLPVFAAFLEGPSADSSPYRPASRVAWNELYLDIESLPELETCAEARRLLGSARIKRERERLWRAPLAEPPSTLAAKRRVLEMLSAALFSGGSGRLRELQEFVAAHPELVAYARFRAALEGASPARSAHAVPVARRGLPPSDDPRVRYHVYAQWAADTQLAEAARRAGLYIDLPVGVHPAGFDPWWRPHAFVAGTSAGAPPDEFFASGQSWGFSPLHPAGLRDEGYGYLAAALRHAMRHAAVVRLDHVMGLHRLWFVPDGMAASDGVYVRYRAEELRAIVVLEAARAGVAVVGEDLGTVPASVRRDMRRDGMLRSHVYQFAATAHDPFPTAPPDALASLGTHDLPPFAAWWRGTDIDDRVRRGFTAEAEAAAERIERRALRRAVGEAVTGTGPMAGTRSAPLSPSRALRACLIHLAAGRARLVVVDPADLWGEREPQNRPGTGAEEANFLRRWAKIWPDDLLPPSGPSTMLRQVDRARRRDGGGPVTGEEKGG